jgi:hypothetical protein
VAALAVQLHQVRVMQVVTVLQQTIQVVAVALVLQVVITLLDLLAQVVPDLLLQ